MTADEEIVVNHDPHFFRMPIETSTLEELLEKKLFNGENIPTLQEMLLEGKSQKTSRLYVEIKPSRIDYERSLHVAERVVSIVDEVEAHDWVVYISSSYRVLQRVLDLDPEARVILLAPTADPEVLREDGFVGAAYEFSVYHENPRLIDDLTDLGLTVGAWTVNDSGLIRSFVDAGMDFIATDEPELMLDLYGP